VPNVRPRTTTLATTRTPITTARIGTLLLGGTGSPLIRDELSIGALGRVCLVSWRGTLRSSRGRPTVDVYTVPLLPGR
jgi:hypothetical protein